MSLHILDTDTLTLFQEGHPEICHRAKEQPQKEIAITVLSVEEQMSGWYTALRRAKGIDGLAWAYRRMAETASFFSRLQIIAFDEPAIRRYLDLKQQKIKVRTMDLRIAATVLEQGAILVTRNTKDFKLIPGLSLTDWSKKEKL